MATAEALSPVIDDVARPSLRRNFSWTLAGNVVYAGCQWGMLVEIAKLGRPEMVGHFALALAIGAPVYMLTNLQLRAVQATDFAAQHRFCDYFRLRLTMTALGFLAIAAIAVACRYDRETLLVILLVGLAKAFEAMSDIYYGRLQQHEQMDRVSISMVIKGVVSLAAMGLVLALTGSLPAASAALALAWLAVLLFYDSRVGWPHGTPLGASSPAVLWRLIRFSAPLGLSMMLISLNTNIPRYFVEHYRGAHDLGIFAALSYLVIAGSTVTNALGQAATPRMAAAFATRRTEFYGLLRKMLLLGLAMGLAGIFGAALFGSALLRLIYRPEYAERVDLLLWLMGAAGISYIFSFLGYAGTATRVFDRLLVPYLLVSGVTFAASFLVRPFGLTGAAWSMGITYLASCAVPLWILHGASKEVGGDSRPAPDRPIGVSHEESRLKPAGQAKPPVLQGRCRILHVVGAMNRGGIETWLMHVLRSIDRQRFRMDFLVHTEQPCAYDDELRSLGARLLRCPHAHQPLAYAARFRQLVAENGPYDVVHSHVHYFNGFVLRLAKSAGIPKRIAHSHNDPRSADARRGRWRRGYAWIAMRGIRRYATGGAAASRLAADSLFGADWQHHDGWRTLSYAIDLAPFSVPVDRTAVCAEIGVPADAFLVGHVGRFVEQKNHHFLIGVMKELIELNPSAHLVLAGDGPLRREIERQAAAAGISDAVHFLGVRPDVPRILGGAMDLFLFPSHFEGLGLVVVEAQAAGLPCLISTEVPEEADVVPALVTRLSLGDEPRAWAKAALAIRSASPAVSPAEALSVVAASSFNIARGVGALEEMYSGC